MVICSSSLQAKQSIVSKLYCEILGNMDASPKDVEEVQKILKEFNINNVQNIPTLKQVDPKC